MEILRHRGEPQAGAQTDRAGLLAALLLALMAARLAALLVNRTDLFFDEAQYWSWSLEPAFGYYSKPPLIAWIIAASTAVCGSGEACIRAASPILHTLTAGLLYLIGRRLYDERVGFWSALTFATLPGVSLSSSLISTDVPLLACWAAALLALAALLDGGGWRAALGLGAAVGIGLNAKYAMAYFALCLVLYLAVTPPRRRWLKDPRLLLALAVALALIAPNIAWNAAHSFATLGHTADNANWGGPLFHPLKMLEFLGGQLGVFGPVLFPALVLTVLATWRAGLRDPERLLVCFTLPPLVLITLQALLSRAHANWAATSYVAATVLVVAWLLDERRRSWLKASLGLHLAAAVALGLALALAGRVDLPGAAAPLARLLGWRDVAAAVTRQVEAAKAAGRPYGAVLTDERLVTASLLYYARGLDVPVLAWRAPGDKPRDHYEMRRPYPPPTTDPVLLVSRYATTSLPGAFRNVSGPREIKVATGGRETRTLYLFDLAGYKGP